LYQGPLGSTLSDRHYLVKDNDDDDMPYKS